MKGGFCLRYLEDSGAWIVGGVGAIYSFITGNFGEATFLLMVMMFLDIVSGVMKGAKAKNLRSAISSAGIIKKGGILLTILFCWVLDRLVSGGQPVFVTMMTWVSIGNEGLSFLENVTALGVKVPDGVKERLGQVKKDYESIREDKDSQI